MAIWNRRFGFEISSPLIRKQYAQNAPPFFAERDWRWRNWISSAHKPLKLGDKRIGLNNAWRKDIPSPRIASVFAVTSEEKE